MTLTHAYARFHRVTTAGAIISGAAVFFLMLFIVADVLVRNFSGESIPGGFEIVQAYILPLVVFPSLAWVYSSGIMPKMDVVLPKLSDSARNRLTTTVLVCEIVTIGIVFVTTAYYAIWGTAVLSSFLAGMNILPQWPMQIIASAGFLLLLIELCFVFFTNRRRQTAELTMKGRDLQDEGEGL